MSIEKAVSNQELSIPCPRCGHETKKTVAWLKRNETFTCEKCESVVAPDSKKLFAAIKKAEKLAADLIRRINKKR